MSAFATPAYRVVRDGRWTCASLEARPSGAVVFRSGPRGCAAFVNGHAIGLIQSRAGGRVSIFIKGFEWRITGVQDAFASHRDAYVSHRIVCGPERAKKILKTIWEQGG